MNRQVTRTLSQIVQQLEAADPGKERTANLKRKGRQVEPDSDESVADDLQKPHGGASAGKATPVAKVEGRDKAGMQRTDIRCAMCGEKTAATEAKDAGDGKMLCEECWSESQMGESGEKFKKLTKEFKKRGDIDDPAALAAWIGRKKYGAKKFQKMAADGHKRK